MPNPNIATATSILGGTLYGAIDTSLDEVLENSSSTLVLKINTLIISNIDGTNAADVSATLSSSAGGTDVFIAHLITVPAKSNLVLISKDISFYLTQNKAINLQASAASDLNYLLSYETIS
tara:strand:+ start:683 stop:1045 length:363 start_codon:yes stop_codon:yes gene_type:complete